MFHHLITYCRPALSDRDIPHRTKVCDEIMDQAQTVIQCIKAKFEVNVITCNVIA